MLRTPLSRVKPQPRRWAKYNHLTLTSTHLSSTDDTTGKQRHDPSTCNSSLHVSSQKTEQFGFPITPLVLGPLLPEGPKWNTRKLPCYNLEEPPEPCQLKSQLNAWSKNLITNLQGMESMIKNHFYQSRHLHCGSLFLYHMQTLTSMGQSRIDWHDNMWIVYTNV